mmetsp:Transcript_167818/g.533609  ORF Transcript_167818/g.533609 Transcript_167818/m.533609 type:complete len:354 (-) Transcript_167818:380-1441(-)
MRLPKRHLASELSPPLGALLAALAPPIVGVGWGASAAVALAAALASRLALCLPGAISGERRRRRQKNAAPGRGGGTLALTGAPGPPSAGHAEELPEFLRQALLSCALRALQEADKGYLEGDRLSQAMKVEHADFCERAREALGGKGWMRRLLETEPSISRIEVAGIHEPCFIARGGRQHAPPGQQQRQLGGPVQQRSGQMLKPTQAGRAPTANPAVRMLRPLKARSGAPPSADRSTAPLAAAAARALAAAPETYLEGSRLSEQLKLELPHFVEQAKAAAGGKGWLKKILEADARISSVKVPGRSDLGFITDARRLLGTSLATASPSGSPPAVPSPTRRGRPPAGTPRRRARRR